MALPESAVRNACGDPARKSDSDDFCEVENPLERQILMERVSTPTESLFETSQENLLYRETLRTEMGGQGQHFLSTSDARLLASLVLGLNDQLGLQNLKHLL